MSERQDREGARKRKKKKLKERSCKIRRRLNEKTRKEIDKRSREKRKGIGKE